jgi:hypothetical protein
MKSPLLALLGCTLAFSCASGDGRDSLALPRGAAVFEDLDVPLTEPPYAQVHANWKQRLDQPYVYVDWVGSYARIGSALAQADRAVRDQGLEPSGPPFALYYDDPGQVAAELLRARACFPVNAAVAPRDELRYDVLESTTVVYAFVAGP